MDSKCFRLMAAERRLLADRWGARLDLLAGRLEALSPDRVLARGYSLTVLERTGATLTRAADARAGDLLRTHLAQGQLASRVEDAPDRNPADGLARRAPEPPAKPRNKSNVRSDEPKLFE